MRSKCKLGPAAKDAAKQMAWSFLPTILLRESRWISQPTKWFKEFARIRNMEKLSELVEIKPQPATAESACREETAKLLKANVYRIKGKVEFASIFPRKKHSTTSDFYY